MDKANSDAIKGTFDFFILNALKAGPLSDVEIAHRVEQMRALLELAAKRSGKPNPGALMVALHRLEQAGWLNIQQDKARADPKHAYSLTAAGRQQLDNEWTRRESALDDFVEDGGLDKSFRTFLSRQG